MVLERGVIRNRAYASQIRNFRGLQYGNITPTDFDMVIEYKNKAFVYAEFKYKDAPLPLGQRLALERACVDEETANKKAIAIIAKHESDPAEDIMAADTIVTEYFWRKKWNIPIKETTTKQISDWFIGMVDRGRT